MIIVKTILLVAVCPPTVTVTRPVVAPAGIVTVRLVEVAAVTVAVVPLNLTILSEGVVLNDVPVTAIDVPTEPASGEKLVMDGDTLKLVVLETERSPTVTDSGPDVAPGGIVTKRLPMPTLVTEQVMLFNLTILLAGVRLNKRPKIVTVEPIGPLAGENDAIANPGLTKTLASYVPAKILLPLVTKVFTLWLTRPEFKGVQMMELSGDINTPPSVPA